MKSKLLLILLLNTSISLMAEIQSDSVYSIIEMMPEYSGGKHAIIDFMNRNLQFPEDAMLQHWEGKVLCSMIVEKDGTLTNVEIEKSSGFESVDNEALRVVSLMNQWSPGQLEGQPIRCKISLPVFFHQSPHHNPEHFGKSIPHHHRPDSIPLIDEKGNYLFVEQMPQFKGGINAFANYLKANIKFQSDQHNLRTICQIVIKKSGKIGNVSVLRTSGNPEFDLEAVRVLSQMPKWIPGRQNGKKVEVLYTMPVMINKIE